MRKALVIGIDHYQKMKCLEGCVNDALNMRSVLERHDNRDKDKNFDVQFKIANDEKSIITKDELKDEIEDLFRDKREVSLLYFAGHGHIESTGGFLITSECERGDNGMSMRELLDIVNDSPAQSNIIILDCCHSGELGSLKTGSDMSNIQEGVTILAAADKNQYALGDKKSKQGLFTRSLVNALKGSAANILGDITPGSVYAHIDMSLGELGQRPIFKTNVRRFTVLRKVKSQLEKPDLLKITDFFRDKDDLFDLDPSFEPESENPNEENTKKFAILQKYNRVDLVVPVNAPHMYHAAMLRQSCELTSLGKFYWDLVRKKKV